MLSAVSANAPRPSRAAGTADLLAAGAMFPSAPFLACTVASASAELRGLAADAVRERVPAVCCPRRRVVVRELFCALGNSVASAIFGNRGYPMRFCSVGERMQRLRDALTKAHENGVAIGHFNLADMVLLKAVFGSARELNVPVLVGAPKESASFSAFARLQLWYGVCTRNSTFPSFLNADHTRSLDKALEAARAGFDAIVFDLSALPFEQNVRQTRAAVEALKGVNPDVLVEGEIGDIGTGSEIHAQARSRPYNFTTPEEAKQYVESTRIDIFAPAVGNMHGMLASMVQGEAKKRLDIDRIAWRRLIASAGPFALLQRLRQG